MKNEYILVSEVAEILKTNKNVVYSIINSRGLPATKVGQFFLVEKRAVKNLMKKPEGWKPMSDWLEEKNIDRQKFHYLAKKNNIPRKKCFLMEEDRYQRMTFVYPDPEKN